MSGQKQRLIDANAIVEVAEHAYNEWNLAMATADGTREINRVFKMQELCKAVKAVADNAPTIDPEDLRPVGKWEWYEEWKECTTDSPAECQCAGWMCSECGIDLAEYLEETTHEIVYLDDPEWQPKIKFCPNCGTRMEG